ncbi:MAG TPA: hypothetical protein VFP87_03760 [Chitinophagaceae bacterium]|nr:hypothetical protein [Chitinophagaceae bacterium]
MSSIQHDYVQSAKNVKLSKVIFAWFLAGVVMLLLGLAMVYVCIHFFPRIADEYFSPVFRRAGETDWTFYVHPFILSFCLKWFWERYKGILKGGFLLRAIEVALVYGLVALLPILWLTFSAIDVSVKMTITWFVYGIFQAFAAGIVFAKLNP